MQNKGRGYLATFGLGVIGTLMLLAFGHLTLVVIPSLLSAKNTLSNVAGVAIIIFLVLCCFVVVVKTLIEEED